MGQNIFTHLITKKQLFFGKAILNIFKEWPFGLNTVVL